MLEKASEQTIIRDAEDENEPREVYKKRAKFSMQISKPYFAMGIKDMDISSDAAIRARKAYGVIILNEILFSQSSKIYNDLYDEEIITSDFYVSFEHTKNCSYISISDIGDDPEETYERLVSCIEEAKRSGIDKEEFELAKRSVFATSIKAFDSVSEIANDMLYLLFDEGDILDIPDIISSIDYDYVSELLQSMYKEEYYTMAVAEPIER